MNRRELRDELYALGHHYLEDEAGRADRFIDQAAGDVLLTEMWPQRRIVDIVAAQQPLVTLGSIIQVWDTRSGHVLTPTTSEEVVDDYGALDPPVGPPRYYWVEQNAYFWTYPALADGETISVRHAGKGVWEESSGPRYLNAHSDASYLIGDELFDEAVLLAARVRALEDTDETGLRDTITARFDSEMLGLRFRELNLVADEPQRIKQTHEWY